MTTSYENVCAFLYQEARLLDDRDWDAWIEMYDPQAEFWMPAWADDGELTTNPQTEISLIYYPSRGGLEDRVFRIRTERSSARLRANASATKSRRPRPRACGWAATSPLAITSKSAS